jgi:hypothetical protein
MDIGSFMCDAPRHRVHRGMAVRIAGFVNAKRIEAAAGAPRRGRRRSSQIMKMVKNLFIKSCSFNFHKSSGNPNTLAVMIPESQEDQVTKKNQNFFFSNVQKKNQFV